VSGSGEKSGGSPTPEEIQADIERTRADLADTVGQLNDRITERKQQATQVATYAGAAVGALVAVLVVVKIVRKLRS
jgi:uncharacterized membrane protein YebE (DUF533 family)